MDYIYYLRVLGNKIQQFHHQTDGRYEKTIETLEDMLRVYN